MGDLIGLIPELLKKFGGVMGEGGGLGGGGAAQPGANMARTMPMAQAPDQSQPQGQFSDADKKFMQQQQMAQNGQQHMQQMMQNGMSGNVNPGFKDMSQYANMNSLISMLMGGMNGR